MLFNHRVMTCIPDNEAVFKPANAGAEVSGHSTNN